MIIYFNDIIRIFFFEPESRLHLNTDETDFGSFLNSD